MSFDGAAALLPLLALIGAASYFQTVTGFGLGMIVTGVASGLGLAPLATVAAVVSLVSLANSAVALPGCWRHVDRRAFAAATLGIVPAIVAGVLLLDRLSADASALLQLMLGLSIAVGGVRFAMKPVPLARRSSDARFFASGVAGGLMSGLFGVPGPPLIFQFYRQPMGLEQIRSMLLLAFTVTSAARTLTIGLQGQLEAGVWLQAGLAVPVVALATLAGRRWPPPLAPAAMRRIACAVLVMIGAGLVSAASAGVVALVVALSRA